MNAYIQLCGRLWALLLFLGLLYAGPLQAQERLEQDPGYVDLKSIEPWFDGEPRLEVNIRGALLKLVAGASRREDPELADLLLNLKAIEVRGFELAPGDFADVERRTAAFARRLESQGWETVARVREREERVDVFLRIHDDAIAGMAVMVLDPANEDGAVFVNIVGEIDPEQVGRIGSRFQIDALEKAPVARGDR